MTQMVLYWSTSNYYPDAFLVLKPTRSFHEVGLEVAMFEPGRVFLGYATLASKNTLRKENITNTLALSVCGHDAEWLRQKLEEMYPGQQLFDAMAFTWTHRQPDVWQVLIQMKQEEILDQYQPIAAPPILMA